MKIITLNKKAGHEYFLEDTYEAGIVLEGNEIKSVRLGKVNLKDSYAVIDKGEIYLRNCHISAYEKGTYFNRYEALKDRKLLLHKQEIARLVGKINEKGYSLIPTKMYFEGSLVKVEIALAKGKQLHDKRDSLKEKQQKRQLDRVMKEFNQ